MAKTPEQLPATVVAVPAGETDSKCMGEWDAPIARWNPLGGATSFDEADAYERAEESSQAVNELTMAFNMIVGNVLQTDDLTLSVKADKIIKAASDLKKRLASDPIVKGSAAAGVGTAEMSGFWTKLFGKKTAEEGAKDAAPPRVRPSAAGSAHVPGFRMFKDLRGDLRWTAVHSNNFRDKEGEVFPASAHKDFEQHVTETGEYPELRVWHVPGSRIGVADWIAYDDAGFMVSSGTIDPGMKEAAQSLDRLGPLGVSHGYWFDRKEADGSIPVYRDFEISVLPLERAANELTAFAFEEVPSMLPTAKKEALIKVFGAEKADSLESELARAGAKAKESGLGFKEATELVGIFGEGFADGFKNGFKDEAGGDAGAGAATPAAGTTDPAGGMSPEALTAALAAAVSPLMARIDALDASVGEANKAVKALQDEDARMAGRFSPRTGAVIPSMGVNIESLTQAAQAGLKGDSADGVPDHLAPYARLTGMQFAETGA